ncbi:MAG: transposase-like protein [Gammaproteobacteria bacterium]|jgi:transposase-like protein
MNDLKTFFTKLISTFQNASERDWHSKTSLRDERRVKQLEHENRELKRANAILQKASIFFAQADLKQRKQQRQDNKSFNLY